MRRHEKGDYLQDCFKKGLEGGRASSTRGAHDGNNSDEVLCINDSPVSFALVPRTCISLNNNSIWRFGGAVQRRGIELKLCSELWHFLSDDKKMRAGTVRSYAFIRNLEP